jgi:eukaryotic-like serine/threonine-protein kinase
MSRGGFADAVQRAVGDRYHIERALVPPPARHPWQLFLATERPSGRLVAIKAVPTEDLAPDDPRRFEREVGTVDSMPGWLGLPDFGHPRILSIASKGHAEGVLYYVTFWLPEGSLRARLEREKRLPVADAARILGESVEALAFLHERGLLHRSIKPENILFDRGHAVLADWVGHLVEAGAPISVDDVQRDYESPEVIRGSRRDVRSNVYALATVGFEMLAGRRPFIGTATEVAFALVSGAPPPPLTSLRPEAPRRLADVLGRALAPAPEDRFSDVKCFRDALDAATT